jgi:DNA-binding NarL/FixJ family response regulator
MTLSPDISTTTSADRRATPGDDTGVRTIAVAIVEDHPLYREALEQVVRATDDFVLSVAVGSVEEFQARTRHQVPDVTLLDLGLPGVDGSRGVQSLAGRGLAILVLSASIDGQDVVDAVSAGARGYLSKDVQVNEIIAAIRAVHVGKTYVSPMLAGCLLQANRRDITEAPVHLSGREQEIVCLVARGETDHCIAAELGISVSTVRSHLDRIRDKTGQRRRADLTRYALQYDLLESSAS